MGEAGDPWALRAADRALFGSKSGTTRLGFAVLLKVLQAEGRFPRRTEEVPLAAVEALAPQVGVTAAAWRDCGIVTLTGCGRRWSRDGAGTALR